MKADFGGVGRGGEWVTVNNDGGAVRAAPDIVADITAHAAQLEKHFAFGSLDEIRCIHTLEHLPSWDIIATLRYWRVLLKPGGLLHIVVPDMGTMAQHYSSGKIPFDVLASVAYVPASRTKDRPAGEQHRWAWDKHTLIADLETAGYSQIVRWLDYPETWTLDYDDMLHTGLVGAYEVPNLALAGRAS